VLAPPGLQFEAQNLVMVHLVWRCICHDFGRYDVAQAFR
jgi:hypothetical protein